MIETLLDLITFIVAFLFLVILVNLRRFYHGSIFQECWDIMITGAVILIIGIILAIALYSLTGSWFITYYTRSALLIIFIIALVIAIYKHTLEWRRLSTKS